MVEGKAGKHRLKRLKIRNSQELGYLVIACLRMCCKRSVTGMICIDIVLILTFLFISLVLGLNFNSSKLVNRQGAVLVTGASSGIGLSAAKRLKQDGFYVYAACRKEEDMKVLRSFGLTPILLDVTDSSQIEEAVKFVKEANIPLVAVVNNAGTTTKKPLETVKLSKVNQVFNVNVFGALEITQQFLPLLRDSAASEKYGARIVFIGSVSGIISLKLNGVYSMSKYSLEAMADTFRRELQKFGISVSMVNPAYVNTNFRQKGQATIKDSSLSEKEKNMYGKDFEKLERKMKKRVTFASPCCDATDDAISDAIISEYPRTRYYPAVVAKNLPAWVVTPLIRLLGVFTFTERLLDLIIIHFF